MTENKQNFIESIISKLKSKDASHQSSFIRHIGNVRYKYVLFKAKDDGCFHREYARKFDYIYREGSHEFHVRDEEIAKTLYEAIITKELDLENIPEELKDIKFVVVDKLQKVVFITFKNSELMQSMTEENFESRKKVLDKFHILATWLVSNLSLPDKKIVINYETFIKYFFESGQCGLVSLFKSIDVGEEDYQITYSGLNNIIDEFLWFALKDSDLTIEDLRNEVLMCSNPFYYFINSGIYMRSMDNSGFYNLPVHLRINLFRYITDKKQFSNLKDFFEKDGFEKDCNGNVIFSKKHFEEAVELKEDKEDFVVYSRIKSVFNLKDQSDFLLIKDNSLWEEIKETIDLLKSEGLINNVECIYSPFSSEYYLCKHSKNITDISLAEYIEESKYNEEKITKLLTLVNDLFSSKASVRQRLFLKPGVDYMDVLDFDEETSSLSFGDITALSFGKDDVQTTFQYPLCIMQIISKFVCTNSILIEDIYKCSFIKLFPKAFVDEIIQYLNWNEYKPKGMIGKLKGMLTEEDSLKVEFIENISVYDKELLERITFLPGITSDLIAKLQNAKVNPVSSKKAEYISLDEEINFVAKHGDLSLSKKLIDKLTIDKIADAFLIPEKLIISKDIYDDRNYTVIGVIWNKSKLYRFSNLVESKEINIKNIYCAFVSKIINLYHRNILADKLTLEIGSLLMDDSYNVVISCNSYESLKQVYRENSKTLKSYYTDIMKMLSEQFGAQLENFKCFAFEELFDGVENFKSLKKYFCNKIRFCDEHRRLYLSGEMCEVCQRIYLIADAKEDYTMDYQLSMGNTNFFSLNQDNLLGGGVYKSKQGIVWKCDKVTDNDLKLKRIKIGIENSLYNKFATLVPRKIIINQCSSKKVVYGVFCDNYDFSGMMELFSFKYMQRIKAIMVLYKKILPYIQDGTFITQDSNVFWTMFMDKKYKGEVIVPNLPLLKCEVSVSDDEELEQKEKEATLKLFSRFLHNYITSDSALSLELQKNDKELLALVESIQSCQFDEACVRRYLESKDSFCNTHGVYFSGSDQICPECIIQGISKDDAIVLDKEYFDGLKSQKSSHEGGEAKLYFSEDGKIDKIFNDKVDISFKSKVIGKALQKAKLFEEFNSNHDDVKFVTIDKVLYSYEDGYLNLEGYRQSYIPNSFKISSLKEKSFAEQIGYDRKDIVEILIKVCKGIEYLHSIGAFIGDLNGGNILIKDKVVYIIDMDGMSYDDVRNCMYTNTYIYPPSAENKNITKLDDWYSLAVQAFYYLTYSHPFRGVCRNNAIPESEIERMKYGFSVLGNHGITVPSISIGWDLLPKQMIKFFLDTFEGSKRESMLGILQSYLGVIEKSEMNFEEVARNNQVLFAISENMYIDVYNNLYYNEEYKSGILLANNSYKDILHIGSFMVFNGKSSTTVVNDKTGDLYVFDKTYEKIHYVHDNKIYYTDVSNTDIYIDELDVETKEISTHLLRRESNNQICILSGDGNGRFVLVENNEDEETFEVLCNNKVICSFNKRIFSEQEMVDIIYDEDSCSWIVLLSCHDQYFGVTIDISGRHRRFTLKQKLSPALSFYRNTLYFVGDKSIYAYNVNSETLKTIYCRVVTPESSIERFGNKFIITNEKETYRYVKS